jgi:hypothetical protein
MIDYHVIDYHVIDYNVWCREWHPASDKDVDLFRYVSVPAQPVMVVVAVVAILSETLG